MGLNTLRCGRSHWCHNMSRVHVHQSGPTYRHWRRSELGIIRMICVAHTAYPWLDPLTCWTSRKDQALIALEEIVDSAGCSFAGSGLKQAFRKRCTTSTRFECDWRYGPWCSLLPITIQTPRRHNISRAKRK